MPMYGQSFSLADNNENGLNAATYGGGEAGEETRARGFLAYYEVGKVKRRVLVILKVFCIPRFALTSLKKAGK